MIALEDRRQMAAWIAEARAAGARLAPVCELLSLDPRTLQRWQSDAGLEVGDHRPQAVRPKPAYALSEEEQATILLLANAPEFAALPPAQIVPRLADQGRYVASESSFHRVLKAHGQSQRRGRAKRPEARRTPTTRTASKPGEVWCWDVTWLPSQVTGRWFYLYLILDLYSRKIVAHEVHEVESGEHACALLKRAALAEGVHAALHKPFLHGDNGAALKSTTVLAVLHWLRIAPSYSRPRVSDDNSFVESLFRTAKYRPGFPVEGFADLAAARRWGAQFVARYNEEHRHSGLRYVTPSERNAGHDQRLLEQRDTRYQAARLRNPQGWRRDTCNWNPIGPVTLNPERDCLAGKAQLDSESKRRAA